MFMYFVRTIDSKEEMLANTYVYKRWGGMFIPLIQKPQVASNIAIFKG